MKRFALGPVLGVLSCSSLALAGPTTDEVLHDLLKHLLVPRYQKSYNSHSAIGRLSLDHVAQDDMLGRLRASITDSKPFEIGLYSGEHGKSVFMNAGKFEVHLSSRDPKFFAVEGESFNRWIRSEEGVDAFLKSFWKQAEGAKLDFAVIAKGDGAIPRETSGPEQRISILTPLKSESEFLKAIAPSMKSERDFIERKVASLTAGPDAGRCRIERSGQIDAEITRLTRDLDRLKDISEYQRGFDEADGAFRRVRARLEMLTLQPQYR